jgi:hypothetical protein
MLFIWVVATSAICRSQVAILWYAFDDEANPTANLGTLGSDHDGAVGAGIEFVAFGAGAAIDFDDTSDEWVIPVGDENAFDIADGDFSVSGTIRTDFSDRDAPGVRFIVTKQFTGSLDGWAVSMRPETGALQFGISADGTMNAYVISELAVNDGEAHEFLGVRSGCAIVLLIDGDVAGSVRIPANFGSTAQNDEPLVIGGRSIGGGPTGGPNDEWIGTIDDLKIFDEALFEFVCAADVNGDCSLDILDFVAFQSQWQQQTPLGDCDGNGLYNILDFVCFQIMFQDGCDDS